MNKEAYKRPLIILAVLILLVSFGYYRKSNATTNPPDPHKEDKNGSGKVVITDNPIPAINEQVKQQQQELITLKEALGKTKEDLCRTQKVVADVRENLDWLGDDVDEKQRQQVWRDRKIMATLDKHDKKLNTMDRERNDTKKEDFYEIEGKAEIKPFRPK